MSFLQLWMLLRGLVNGTMEQRKKSCDTLYKLYKVDDKEMDE